MAVRRESSSLLDMINPLILFPPTQQLPAVAIWLTLVIQRGSVGAGDRDADDAGRRDRAGRVEGAFGPIRVALAAAQRAVHHANSAVATQSPPGQLEQPDDHAAAQPCNDAVNVEWPNPGGRPTGTISVGSHAALFPARASAVGGGKLERVDQDSQGQRCADSRARVELHRRSPDECEPCHEKVSTRFASESILVQRRSSWYAVASDRCAGVA